jgi:pre-mRNA-splicing factor ATP-dependent RNA helicase DHX16
MLLREMMTNPSLDGYTAVVIDEAHERSVNTDILMPLVKDIARARPEMRIIISSATLNAQAFSVSFHQRRIFRRISDSI